MQSRKSGGEEARLAGEGEAQGVRGTGGPEEVAIGDAQAAQERLESTKDGAPYDYSDQKFRLLPKQEGGSGESIEAVRSPKACSSIFRGA
uniref:Uncharacterized protein n=1 Tax=Ditylenchus dipsaci TaxID=166011 RepID=A0A915D9R5_9BILA